MKHIIKTVSVMLALLMIFTAFPARTTVAKAAGGNWYCYLTYSDIQAKKDAPQQNIGNNTIYSQQLLSSGGYQRVYLARNEAEGFQVYFHELGTENNTGRQLRVAVEPFKNSSGDILPFKMFEEIYFSEPTTHQYELAEALVPYDGTFVETTVGENVMFYVELKSAKDQPAGEYTSKVTIYDADGVVQVKPIKAIVWNFALPEAHYCTTTMGLYNAASDYRATSGFLKAVGVRFDGNGEILEEDIPFAESVLEAWDEVLLEHGIVPTEIPRFLIDTDEKAAALKLADPRRSVYTVPIVNYDAVTPEVTAKIRQYKNLVYDNDFLREKAVFYAGDELSFPSGANDPANIPYNERISAINTLWPGAHILVSTNHLDKFSKDLLRETADTICVNQCLLVDAENDVGDAKQKAREFLTEDSWDQVFRYDAPLRSGTVEMFIDPFSTNGPLRRCLYWQQEAIGKKGGVLHWNCAFLPTINGQLFDVWENNQLPPGTGTQKNNGNGLLIYPGTALGLDPTEPVVSLRMKQLASGMDDYDYLQLAKECFGVESDVYQSAMTGFLGSNWSATSNSIYSIGSWDVNPINETRVALGNALSEAWYAEGSDHRYSDWQSVVVPDETHEGMMIRVCEKCGAQESKRVTLCAENEHDWSVYKKNDETVHYVSCSACGKEKTEAHSWDDGFVSVPASCTREGETTFTCTLCGETKTETSGKLRHVSASPVKENEVAPTCTSEGSYDSVVYCRNCPTELFRETITVKKLDHTPAVAVVENEVPATCTKKGSYDSVVYCVNCPAEISRTTVSTNKLPHTPVTLPGTPATCAKTGLTDGQICASCGNTITPQQAIPATGKHVDSNGDGKCDTCGTDVGAPSGPNVCKWCGKEHGSGFIDTLVAFFHRIFAAIFGAKY